MKITILLSLMILSLGQIFPQPSEFSAFNLTTLNGENISFTDLLKTDQPTVLIFWKAGSTHCCDNLENMQSAWLNQLKERNVRFIAICVNCDGDWSRVKPQVYGNDWEFEVYLDVNGDCRRAMNITTFPFTMLFDEDQKLICSYAGYCKGNEDLICFKILNLLSVKNEELISENIK